MGNVILYKPAPHTPPIKSKKVGEVCNRVFRWTPPRVICLPALGRWTPKDGRFDPTRVVFGASGDFFRRGLLPEEVSLEHFERYFKSLVNPRAPIWHRLGGFPRNRGLLQARPSAGRSVLGAFELAFGVFCDLLCMPKYIFRQHTYDVSSLNTCGHTES